MADKNLDLDFDFDAPAAPSLTLDPAPAAEEAPAPAAQEAEAAPVVNLSDEEQAMVDAFAEKIDLTNSQQVLQYGSACQKKIGDFSEAALAKVSTRDLGEVGEMITDLVAELKSFDAAEEEKGLLGFFKRKASQIDQLKTRYNKAETNVENIQSMLEGHQVQLLKDIAMLDKMYELNMAYFKELSMYILAGKKKLAEVRAGELARAMEKAKASGLPEAAQAARDLSDQCDRFEKKLYDLELTRNISLQMGPQIRLLQNNNTLMAEKIQSTIVNTIPLWKNQMVLALGLAHSQQAMEAQRAVTNMTNDLLKKNAEALKMGTLETARETQRGVVDIETLQATNKSLIETLDELNKIQTEGRAKRAAAQQELTRIEDELKQKMMEIRR
ncbi:MAG: toxic anion resistance protein [Candidatus Faecalibacterium intestinavium]|uniref:Toxic anion resistance protein n=1 Tax=Candidatus Faecalibacterium intestinavium TaxID=2838580 RepID=A0A9E2KLW2_9FIRM|nr:toxic anion resistance protein [Candidatus Faecalibacterium intestinavium]